MRLLAAQRVNNQYKRRSLFKVKYQMFPVIIDAPTVVIYEKICPDLVLNQAALDRRSNASPLTTVCQSVHRVASYYSHHSCHGVTRPLACQEAVVSSTGHWHVKRLL